MRELNFRAWIDYPPEHAKQMVEVFGIQFDSIDTYISWVDDGEMRTTPIHEDCIMQYTGMHDINHRAIFEGDVVRVLDFGDVGFVAFRDGEFIIMEIGPDGKAGKYASLRDNDGTMEVIGNVHENPYLLTKETT